MGQAALKLVQSFAPPDVMGDGGRLMVKEFTSALRAVEAMAKGEALGVLVGETGAGKTSVCEAYAEKNARALLITAPCRMEYTDGGFMRHVGAQLGVSANSLKDLGAGIRDAMMSQQRALIVDEATHLPVAAMDWLRRINDDTQRPVVFVGLPSLWSKIRLHGGEIAGRVGIKHTMRSLTEEECRRTCAHLGEEVFNEVFRRTQGRMRDLLTALRLLDECQKENAVRWASLADLPVRAVQKVLSEHFLGSEA